MLSYEDNKLLTETGPNTPMGDMLRRYWIPALVSEDLPAPDCPPVRIKLLGENLVAFRDSNNQVGLFDEHCPHRRASLFFGRNEECGLRCVYHGWKFDVSGQCVDMPSEPDESNFKDHVKVKSYTCKESGGVIWAYMGPPEQMPELPPFGFRFVDPANRKIRRSINEGNYWQGIESALDSSHLSFLHRRKSPRFSGFVGGTPNQEMQVITHKYGNPKFEVIKTEYGMLVGAKRDTDDPGKKFWRITQFVMPWYQMIPPNSLDPNEKDGPCAMTCWVPIDDETSMSWGFYWDPVHAIDGPNNRTMFRAPELIPGTFTTKANKSNDYLIDREVQASGETFTGMNNGVTEDQAMTESQGPIADRTKEKLGTSDTAIIVGRNIMLKAAKGLQKGETPPGLDPESIKVRAVSVILDEGVSFQEEAKDYLRADIPV